jgi:replicative DNA helicase
MQQRKFSNSVLDEIKKSCDRVKTEAAGRKEEEPLSFGVPYLDDCLGGIYKNDFIILGAKTGLGKSEMAKICAQANATNKQVYFFALEAEVNEIERRIKYSLISEAIHGPLKSRFKGINFNYMDWMVGKFNKDLDIYENEMNEQIAQLLPGLHTYYQKLSTLTENNIEQTILSIQAKADLIIIDHLHYFDFEDENENRAMKLLLKRLKFLSESAGKPILLLAHLRKTDKRFQGPIPDIEDFHGSSDITKIATKVVMLAPAYKNEGGQSSSRIYGTYVAAVKNRYDSSRTRFVGLCGFDTRRNKYESKYTVGKISFKEKEFEAETSPPYWAANANNGNAVSKNTTSHSGGVQRSFYDSNDSPVDF